MQISGLDLSLTSTGLARLVVTDTGEHVLETTGVLSTGHRGDTVADRARRLEDIKASIVHDCLGVDLVVIEGPAFSRSNSGTWDRAGLWWLVVAWLQDVVPVAVVGPSTLKKYATGKGNATKPDMRMALYQRYGDDISSDDQVDAAWLALAGAQWLQRPVVAMPAANVSALDKAEWPEPLDGDSGDGDLLDGDVEIDADGTRRNVATASSRVGGAA